MKLYFLSLVLLSLSSLHAFETYGPSSLNCTGEYQENKNGGYYPPFGYLFMALKIEMKKKCFKDILGQKRCRETRWSVAIGESVSQAERKIQRGHSMNFLGEILDISEDEITFGNFKEGRIYLALEKSHYAESGSYAGIFMSNNAIYQVSCL